MKQKNNKTEKMTEKFQSNKKTSEFCKISKKKNDRDLIDVKQKKVDT